MPITLYVLGVIVGIFVLIQAGKLVVRSLVAMARYLNISEFVLSFILVAFVTSLPELTIGINSAIVGISELSFGDILGTNIINFTLILGVVSIIGGKITLKDYGHFRENRYFELVSLLAPLVLMLDGVLSAGDGIVLLLLFLANIAHLLDLDDVLLGKKVLRPHLAKQVHHTAASRKEFYANLGKFILGVAFLLGAATTIVHSIQFISIALSVPSVLMGVLVVALGTSLPELSVGIRSVTSKEGGISLGDIFGSSVMNSTLVLGVVSIISPITLESTGTLVVGLVFTLVSFMAVVFFLRSKKDVLERKEGYVLVGIYILFLAAAVLTSGMGIL